MGLPADDGIVSTGNQYNRFNNQANGQPVGGGGGNYMTGIRQNQQQQQVQDDENQRLVAQGNQQQGQGFQAFQGRGVTLG